MCHGRGHRGDADHHQLWFIHLWLCGELWVSLCRQRCGFVLAVQPFLFAPPCLSASVSASPLEVLFSLVAERGFVWSQASSACPGDLSPRWCSLSLSWCWALLSGSGVLDTRCQPLSLSGLSCWSGRQLSVTAKFKQIASQMKYLLLLYFRFVSAFSNPHFS